MRDYLQAMQNALYMAATPDEPAPILLGALRQNMLQLSAEHANGAHPYFVPPEHTAWARGILGPDALLCPEQMLLLETDAATARRIARSHTGNYTVLDNYKNNLKQFGFEEADFENSGSDKLVDAIVAWGDENALKARIQAHWEAGANHVCIQALKSETEHGPNMALLELMAPLNR